MSCIFDILGGADEEALQPVREAVATYVPDAVKNE